MILQNNVGVVIFTNTPTLMNAGREGGQLSAWLSYLLKTVWRYFDALKYNMALVQKSGGGTGFSFNVFASSGFRCVLVGAARSIRLENI